MNWNTALSDSWRRAEDSKHRAKRQEWLCAMILAKKIRPGADIISQDTATKLRGAWAIYETLRHYDAKKARELRNKYGYRRFLEMGALWMQYEFSADAAIDHLESELSNGAMKMQIIDAHDPLPEWRRKCYGMLKTGEKLVSSYDMPDDFKGWVKQGNELMKGLK